MILDEAPGKKLLIAPKRNQKRKKSKKDSQLQKRFVLPLALSLSSVLLAQRYRRFQGPQKFARWSQDGRLLSWKGELFHPLSWTVAKTNPKAARTPRTQGSRSSFDPRKAFALIPKDRRLSSRGGRRPRFSTLPRNPQPPRGIVRAPRSNRWFAALQAELWTASPKEKARKIADGLDGIRHVSIAPGGRTVSFIQNKDLFLLRVADGKRLRLTQDGSENIFNGELDWVYQEEVYGRGNFQGAWWSPQGKHLAFVRIDEEPVDTFEIVDYLPQTLRIEKIKYPKPGRANPLIALRVAEAETGRVRELDLSRYSPKDQILIVRVGWTPNGDRLIFMVQNREQTWLDLNFADPKTGKFVRILRETCENGWVQRLPMPRWLEDGSFLWESDRTGYHHIYRYDRGGKLLGAVSHGNWSAGRIIRVDEARGQIAFYGTTETDWIGQHAYLAALDGSWQKRVTQGRGTHRVEFNHDLSLILDRFSSLENPGEQWLRNTQGKTLRKIYARPIPKGARYPILKRIRARDGEALDLTYTPPAKLEPGKRYPLWINTYSGPAAPSIRDSYRGPARPTWYGRLQVNVRSATKRGMKYTKTCYKQLGVQELKDLEDAIDWMAKHFSWVDPSRVGISGGSYGGFITAFALTHSSKFKCGVASSGVYDWKLYDTIYTERFMQTPQNNPAGYKRASVIAAAKNLHGNLLILHGIKDDNVHFQNAIQLVHALQRAGKQNFAFMPYALSRHGVGGRHTSRLRADFIRKNL
jgi:dipeptidyl-peptidase-4